MLTLVLLNMQNFNILIHCIWFLDTSLYFSQFEGSQIVEEQNEHFSGIYIVSVVFF
jgi:hypothetical protein